jgi:DNA-binding IclR family transcriptional regulator
VLLAFRTPEERAMLISEYEGKHEVNPQASSDFFERLDQIRVLGYEMMPSHQMAGIVNLSAPVLSPDGQAIAALTIPYVTIINQPSAPDINRTIQILLDTTRQLSSLAGLDLVKE